MEKPIIQAIKNWVKDFEATQPRNVEIDEETFEGSAYLVFKTILAVEKKEIKQ